MYGPVTVASIDATDMVSPAAPTLSLLQLSNSEIEAKIGIPALDSNGAPVSGLAGLVVGIAAEVDGVNPFEGVNGADIKAVAVAAGGDAQEKELVDSDAGTEIIAVLPIIEVGKKYWVAASVKDNS